MTVDATNISRPEGASDEDPGSSVALREQAFEKIRAGELAQAVDLFSRASAHDPDDPQAQLGLGIALQGMRRHAEALVPLERAQKALPNGPLPFLHASRSLLALGEDKAALQAASEACERAPQLAQAHLALGQALMALNEPARAEKAFAAALRLAPQLADAWVLCGVARFSQGGIEGAKAALREALRVAPGHETAKANLDALERLGGGRHAAASATPDAGARSAVDQSEVEDNVTLSSWRPEDMAAALGLAVDYLSRKPAFARLQFGAWSQVLSNQVARGHFFFVVDQARRVRGFLGWGLTREDLAEKWLEGRARLREDECREGDCVIINAFAAESRDAKRFIVDTMRGLFTNKDALYFKRYYPDGRKRPMRLSANDFVASHLSRRQRGPSS
jgi:Flp pilus assembly protein TadD